MRSGAAARGPRPPEPGTPLAGIGHESAGGRRMAKIDAFLKLGREQGCSDVHLSVGVPPMLRMNGELMPIKFRNLGDTELEGYVSELLTPSQRERFEAGEDLDFAYAAQDIGRFRVNLFRKLTGVGATIRHIPEHIPDWEQLGLPPLIEQISWYHQGLVLVTGSTGTGKSTTLAAIIDLINQRDRRNIVTLEDPIEFVHSSGQCQVVQRELGTHVPDFSRGLRAALREDPDVILVGELRDPETISLAMTAAETGHLVLATLHTTTAVKTIDRIIDAMPPEQHEQVKLFLSQHLRAVVSQQLVRTPDARGRRAIVETMVVNHAIANLINQDKTFQIPNQIRSGGHLGMQLMDQALLAAVQNKEVDPDDAYLHANDRSQFQRFVVDSSLLPRSDLAGG
jgi:twitching motility protein PilT